MKKYLFLLLFFTPYILSKTNNKLNNGSESDNQSKSRTCTHYAKASAFTSTALRLRSTHTLKNLHTINKHQAAAKTLTKANRLASSSSKWHNFQKLLFGTGSQAQIPIATSIAEKSFIIPATATTSLSSQVFMPLGVLAIYYATTYGTEKAQQWYHEHNQKKRDAFIPHSILEQAKIEHEELAKLNSHTQNNDNEEKTWWEKNEHKFPLWSASIFAAYNAGQLAKEEYNKPTPFEQLIDYFENPKQNNFGDNAFESFQKLDETENNEKIILLNKKYTSKWNFKAKYDTSTAPVYMTLDQQAYTQLPQENNVIHNTLQQLCNVYDNDQIAHSPDSYIRIPITTQKYGTYYAFIPTSKSMGPIECYHEKAFHNNLNNIQYRKIYNLMHSQDHFSIPLSFEELVQ